MSNLFYTCVQKSAQLEREASSFCGHFFCVRWLFTFQPFMPSTEWQSLAKKNSDRIFLDKKVEQKMFCRLS